MKTIHAWFGDGQELTVGTVAP